MGGDAGSSRVGGQDFVNDLMSLRWETRASQPFHIGASWEQQSFARALQGVGASFRVFLLSACQAGARISSLSVGQEQPHELQ